MLHDYEISENKYLFNLEKQKLRRRKTKLVELQKCRNKIGLLISTKKNEFPTRKPQPV